MKVWNGLNHRLMLLLGMGGYCITAFAVPVTFEYWSYYTPFSCDSAKILGDFTGIIWPERPMKNISTNYFIYDTTLSPGNYKFNIHSFITLGTVWSEYIVSARYYYLSESDSILIGHGIRADSVKVNGTLLDSAYLIDNFQGGGNFSIAVSSTGSISPGPGESLTVIPGVPPETQCKRLYARYSVPWDYDPTWNAGKPWMVAIHDKRKGGVDTVWVDYMRFYVRKNNGQDTLLIAFEFTNANDTLFGGGLYFRYPWFALPDSHANLPYTISNGYLVLAPSNHPDRVLHWWIPNYFHCTIPQNAQYCWFAFRIRIKGNALVQSGIDFWKDDTSSPWSENNKEAGATNWYFENNQQWQTDTLKLYGIEESPLEKTVSPELILMPNPASSYVIFNKSLSGYIYEVSGRLITKINRKRGEKFDLSDYSNMVYLFIDDRKEIRCKLIVLKRVFY